MALWLGNARILLERKKTFYYNLTIKVSINSQLDKKLFFTQKAHLENMILSESGNYMYHVIM